MKYDMLIEILHSKAGMQIPHFVDIEDFTDDLDIAYQLGLDVGEAKLARKLLDLIT